MFWIIGIIVILIVLGIIFVLLRGDEDDWILDSNGVYIKHGNPFNVPDYVRAQQETVACALSLYNDKKNSGMDFISQCIGKCGDYSVDIVHIPRSEEDNKVENQCADFRAGVTNHFIELDSKGEIVRIV